MYPLEGKEEESARAPLSKPAPKNHRTVDRVTRILEEVVYNPGMTIAELVRTLGAAKSSVYGFVRGLLAQGWLYEEQGRYYLGPAVYGLTLASGQIRAGHVTHADLAALNKETGVAALLGVQAGDNLIYIAEAGSDSISGFEVRTNIRRSLLATSGGKVLIAGQPDSQREAFLRRRSVEEADLVDEFLEEYWEIERTRIARNIRRRGTRFSLATAVRNQSGEAVAAVTLVGPTVELQPRVEELAKQLLRHVDSWSQRSMTPREAI